MFHFITIYKRLILEYSLFKIFRKWLVTLKTIYPIYTLYIFQIFSNFSDWWIFDRVRTSYVNFPFDRLFLVVVICVVIQKWSQIESQLIHPLWNPFEPLTQLSPKSDIWVRDSGWDWLRFEIFHEIGPRNHPDVALEAWHVSVVEFNHKGGVGPVIISLKHQRLHTHSFHKAHSIIWCHCCQIPFTNDF